MEYLSRCMNQLKSNLDFNFHPRCEKLNITHLMFADDLLLFARADKISVKLLLDAFSKFSSASGLEANMDKSNIYFGGASVLDKTDILAGEKISEACLPFGYLGVPLSSKKMSYQQCKPLVDKILARAKVWSTKFLSYAGRLFLIKTILFGMQTFWCQIFILPKRIIKEVEAYCRCFLWTGDTAASKKALVAWDKLYLPRNSSSWSVDSFYMKGKNPLQVPTPGSVLGLLKRFSTIERLFYRLVDGTKLLLMGNIALVRLYTTDRLQAWGIQCTDKCVMCSVGKETVEHLFFDCCFSSTVWNKVLLQIGIHGSSTGFASELHKVVKRIRKTGVVDKLYVMCFTEAIYSIWLARNAVIFKRPTKSIENIAREILFRVCCRGSEELRSRLLHN
ncbi:uncharacterized protein [Spinacia oleracea]|uniref:Reverse transcriptase domain-containing protein n=1 Tax=Spinacia oleracea TaxID=3562 RepID=A0ABM3QPY2_SPIOL|nr:uncharacterized protein LOC130461365 [Spinacia oleracea]